MSVASACPGDIYSALIHHGPFARRNYHILVVNDEQPIREIVRNILDLHMSVTSGWEFGQELHRRDTDNGLPSASRERRFALVPGQGVLNILVELVHLRFDVGLIEHHCFECGLKAGRANRLGEQFSRRWYVDRSIGR